MRAPHDPSDWFACATRAAAPVLVAALGAAFLGPVGGVVGVLNGCLATFLFDVRGAEAVDHRGRTLLPPSATAFAVRRAT